MYFTLSLFKIAFHRCPLYNLLPHLKKMLKMQLKETCESKNTRIQVILLRLKPTWKSRTEIKVNFGLEWIELSLIQADQTECFSKKRKQSIKGLNERRTYKHQKDTDDYKHFEVLHKVRTKPGHAAISRGYVAIFVQAHCPGREENHAFYNNKHYVLSLALCFRFMRLLSLSKWSV